MTIITHFLISSSMLSESTFSKRSAFEAPPPTPVPDLEWPDKSKEEEDEIPDEDDPDPGYRLVPGLRTRLPCRGFRDKKLEPGQEGSKKSASACRERNGH